MSPKRIAFALATTFVVVLCVFACSEHEESFSPPKVDRSNGLLVSLSDESDSLHLALPPALQAVAVEISDKVRGMKSDVYSLCSEDSSGDTLYGFHLLRFLRSEEFRRCYGVGEDGSIEPALAAWDSRFDQGHISQDSLDVYADEDFVAAHADYMGAVRRLSDVFVPIVSTADRLASVHFNARSFPSLSVYSESFLRSRGWNVIDTTYLFEEFRYRGGMSAISAEWLDDFKDGPCVYVRYFDKTILLEYAVFDSTSVLPSYVTAVFEYPCMLDTEE